MPRKTNAHTPTDKTRGEVGALSSYGITEAEIARYLGIDPKTLRKYYREELDTAHIKRNAVVGNFLFNAASGRAMASDGATYRDCLTSAIFWAKTRMGWRETANLDHTSSDGTMSGPTKILLISPPDDNTAD